jgi:hypothetical protein
LRKLIKYRKCRANAFENKKPVFITDLSVLPLIDMEKGLYLLSVATAQQEQD